jgi:quercetin dioxygenase-like cupin family protein
MTIETVPPQGDNKFVISKNSEEAWVNGAGRRTFIAYRDLGMLEATNGQVNIQASLVRDGSQAPQTGWHYHECNYQIVYVLDGWVDMQFFEGETIRLSAGDCINIPPGQPQNEIAISDNFRALEIRSPKDIGTVPCEPVVRA